MKNVSDTEVTYTLSYDLISDAVVGDATEDRSDDALAGYARNLSGNVSFRDSDGMEIKTVTVPAGAEARVEAFVSLSKADMDYMDRYFENGTYAEGYIYLKNNQLFLIFVNKFLPVLFAEKLFVKVGCCCCLA